MALSGRIVFANAKDGKAVAPEQHEKVLSYLFESAYQIAGNHNLTSGRQKTVAVLAVKKICERYGIDSTGAETTPGQIVGDFKVGSGVSISKPAYCMGYDNAEMQKLDSIAAKIAVVF